MCFNQISCNRGKTDGETKKSKNVFFNKNVLDLNQKHLLVFQAGCLVKNTKEKSGDTQKTELKTLSFCFVFLVSPELCCSRK